jgi:LTXXQ motif family protein
METAMQHTIRTLSLAAVLAAAFGLAAIAQTTDPHHPAPGDQPSPEARQATPQQADPMMGMMQDMMGAMPAMPMMQMMQMMSAMHGQAPAGGIDLTERVEGRIAFLRAELAINDEQADEWDAFANALRKYSDLLKTARVSAPDGMTPGLAGSLDQRERQLAAELEGVRAVKAALGPLLGVLTGAQRNAADKLLPMNMGLGMPRRLMPGGRMQDGTMPGGAMQDMAP